MGNLHQLPLFPLNTVLFPGMSLPLHVFEPRYRVMVKRCLKLNQPFGVALIREGDEVGGGATPHEVGTAAQITHVQPLDEGRMNIQTVGTERFRIRELQQEEPFPVGLVEDYPLAGLRAVEVGSLADQLRMMLKAYLNVLAKTSANDISVGALPDDAMTLAYLVGSTLPLPGHEKQALLAAESLTSLLKSERTLLQRELMLIGHMIHHQQPVGNADMPFSLN